MTTMLNAASTTLPALRCPKCAAEMATYERSGVVVDQCRQCRGIYLDLAELARTYLGPDVIFPPMPDPPPGFVTRITVDRVSGLGPGGPAR